MDISQEEFMKKWNMTEEEFEDDLTLASATELAKLRTDNEALVTSWENTMQDNERLGKTIEQLRKVVKYYSDLDKYETDSVTNSREILKDRGRFAREAMQWM